MDNKIILNNKTIMKNRYMSDAQLFVILGSTMLFMLSPNVLFATNGVIAGMDSLRSFISSIVTAIGAFLAVYSFTILGPGFSQHDNSQIKQGLMTLVGAAIMIFHTQILGLMGIS